MKKIDLFIAHLGNGATCCDKSRERSGDYLKVAHISDTGIISYYEALLPEDREAIKVYAWETYGRDYQIQQRIHQVYPSSKLSKINSPLNPELFVKQLTVILNDETFLIKLYKHKFASELYAEQLFYIYSIHKS